jgi:Na+/glutamate symporter
MVYNIHMFFFMGAFRQCFFMLNFDHLAKSKFQFYFFQIVLFSKKSPKIEKKNFKIAMFLLHIKKLKKITLWTKLCMKKCLILYPILLMFINSLISYEYGYRNIIHTMEFNKLDTLFIKCSN